jgi:hypothetical protein
LRRSLQDPYLESLLLKFVAEHFREDLRKLLSLSVYGVKMLWSEDFERLLAERKKRRKVRSQETLQYHKSIFLRYLEGEELSEQLIDYVVNHENRWLRNVFMEVAPSRGYKMDVRPYQISLGDVIKTVQYLKQHHERCHLVYRLMIEGGLRLSHAVHIVKTFNPKEVVEAPEIHLETPRPVCFNDKGFCRHYAGIRGSQKPCEWAYLSTEALELLKRPAGSNLDRRTATRHATRHGLPTPKTMRKASWRTLAQAVCREKLRSLSRAGLES